jgi:hypothetical protein
MNGIGSREIVGDLSWNSLIMELILFLLMIIHILLNNSLKWLLVLNVYIVKWKRKKE